MDLLFGENQGASSLVIGGKTKTQFALSDEGMKVEMQVGERTVLMLSRLLSCRNVDRKTTQTDTHTKKEKK